MSVLDGLAIRLAVDQRIGAIDVAAISKKSARHAGKGELQVLIAGDGGDIRRRRESSEGTLNRSWHRRVEAVRGRFRPWRSGAEEPNRPRR